MLWMKAWLETRWRMLYALTIPFAMILIFPESPSAANLRMLSSLAVVLVFGVVFLAGAGIRTQSQFQGAKNTHNSMYYTLSLPVSRFRLFAVRVAAGLLESSAVLLVVLCACWLKFPNLHNTSTPADLVKLVLAAIACVSWCHLVSVFLATFLDELWQIWGSFLVIGGLWWMIAKLRLPPAFDVSRFMSEASPLLTHVLPWPAMLVSLLVSAILFFAALRIVQTREY